MTLPFHELTGADLHALAGALRAGKLAAPFSELALASLCSADRVDSVGSGLRSLTEAGAPPAVIATLLEAIADARASTRVAEDVVDLVWSGPETEGLTNRSTGVVVANLFRHARRDVVVAGYAVHQGRDVFRALADRMVELPDLTVRMYLDIRRRRDTSASSEIVRRFVHDFRTREWPGQRLPELYYDPRSLETDKPKRSALHAKCVVVDDEVAFVSSANFTEAAQARNIEAGAMIRSPHFARQLAGHFHALARAGILVRAETGT